MLAHLVTQEKVRGPFLVVAPVSTLGHWQREVLTWTRLSCVVLHGAADARRSLLAHETRHTDGAHKPTGRLRFHLMLTTPDALNAEATALSQRPKTMRPTPKKS